jgi:hypothetical protein
MTGSTPICKGCQRTPSHIDEYQEMADALKLTPDEYVEQYEETFDLRTRQFFCTPCWERAGMPIRTPEGIRLLGGRPSYPKQ